MTDLTIPVAVDGTVIPASDHNNLRTALQEDHVPRNSSSVATNEAGSLGSTTYRWLAAYITKIWLGDPADTNTFELSAGDIVIKRNNVEKLRLEATGIDGSFLKAATVGTTELESGAVTQIKTFSKTMSSSTASLGNVAISVSSGSISTALGTPQTVVSVTLTTTGRPVMLRCIGADDGSLGGSGFTSATGSTGGYVWFFEDSTNLVRYNLTDADTSGVSTWAASALSHVTVPAAGTYVYSVRIGAATGNFGAYQVKLLAYEL